MDERQRGVIVVGFWGDAHASGQQASPAARGMIAEIEFPRLQSRVALLDRLPANVGEPLMQLGEQAFCACACPDQKSLGCVLGNALLQRFLQLLQRRNRAKQHLPLAPVVLGDGDASFVSAWING